MLLLSGFKSMSMSSSELKTPFRVRDIRICSSCGVSGTGSFTGTDEGGIDVEPEDVVVVWLPIVKKVLFNLSLPRKVLN